MKRAVTSALAMLVGALCLAAIVAASALALVPDGNQGWYWQMPQPSGDLQGLYDVAMPSSNQAWAVGGGGLIFHSADAGASWTPQTSGTAAELWSVEFADDHNGWVLGEVLLRTTDAGATWTEATPSGAKGLYSLSVVGADECWLGALAGMLLHTTDGGATWQTHHLNATGALNVDFVDAAHGWAKDARGQLWRTVDGGATWKLVTDTLPARGWFSKLTFTDQDHGWLDVFARRSQIWTTSDAGATWRMVLKSRGEAFDGPLVAVDSSHAWLAEEDYPDTPIDTGSVSYILRTSDGGATWSRTCVGSTPLGALAASGDTLISLGDPGPVRSTDGGATWTSSVSEAGYSFTAAQAVGPTDVWATDQHGALLHSSDGLHWQEQPDPVRWSVELHGLSFSDATDGWLVGNESVGVVGPLEAKGVLLHTVDAGATWQRTASPLNGGLSAADFIDAQHGWVVSATSWDKEIARTADGGQTWTSQRVPGLGAQLSAVDFIDAKHGWVAGSYGKRISPHAYTQVGGLFATTDGGAIWHRQDIPGGSHEVTQVQFLDAENGWAVGRGVHGWVAHTTDGGRTWTRLAGFAHADFSSVRFTDPSHGWLGGYWDVYATSDGGATWQRVAASGYDTIIAASDAQHVWGFGDGGLVSTIDGAGDLAAPTTFDDADWAWHGSALTLHLWPSDIGGSGLASTRYSLDGGSSWQTGTAVGFAAPADHSTDGTHEVLYRSSDAAGNVEATRLAKVRIDTLGPKCAVPWKEVVDAGTKGILRFKATDATSGVARAEITISDRSGHVVRDFVRRAGNWDQYPRPPYFWIRFAADLKPGYYHVAVTATDQAGNAQVRAGHNLLHVVASGAPKQSPPHWQQGLPGNFFVTGSFGAARASASSRLPPYALQPRGQ